MGTGRGHEHIVPNQAKNAGTTPNSPKKGGCHSASENPIGIETSSLAALARILEVSQRIRKPDRD